MYTEEPQAAVVQGTQTWARNGSGNRGDGLLTESVGKWCEVTDYHMDRACA